MTPQLNSNDANNKPSLTLCSQHSLDKLVDEFLSVAPDTPVLVRMSLRGEALLGRVELERPQEVVCLLEVSADSRDFVDEVLNAGDAVLSERGLNDGVVGEGDSGPVDLAVSSLVDKLPDQAL